MRPLNCIVCGKGISIRGPAICQYHAKGVGQALGALTWGWVEFVEDWRGGGVDLMHAVCFAETHGVSALIAAVHRRDELNRGVVPRLMMEIDELRKRRRPN